MPRPKTLRERIDERPTVERQWFRLLQERGRELNRLEREQLEAERRHHERVQRFLNGD